MSTEQAPSAFRAAQCAASGEAFAFRLLVAGPFTPKNSARPAAGASRSRPFDAARLISRADSTRNLVPAAALYFLAAEAAFLIGTLSDRTFAPFWPSKAVLFGIFMPAPWRSLWSYVLAVLPVHARAEVGRATAIVCLSAEGSLPRSTAA